MNHSETSPKSTPQLFPTSTFSLEGFLARLSRLPESVWDLTIPVELSSSRLHESLKKSSPVYFSLRTSKDSSATTTDELSTSSFQRLMSWGTTSNGRCLTAKITESPKIGSACSLSDILEEHPDPKYFLSEKIASFLLGRSGTKQGNYQVPKLKLLEP